MKLVNKKDRLQEKPYHLENVLEFSKTKVLHLQIRKGAKIPEHNTPENALVIVQRGKLLFKVAESDSELNVENFIYLSPAEKHSLEALEDSDVMVIKIGE